MKENEIPTYVVEINRPLAITTQIVDEHETKRTTIIAHANLLKFHSQLNASYAHIIRSAKQCTIKQLLWGFWWYPEKPISQCYEPKPKPQPDNTYQDFELFPILPKISSDNCFLLTSFNYDTSFVKVKAGHVTSSFDRWYLSISEYITESPDTLFWGMDANISWNRLN